MKYKSRRWKYSKDRQLLTVSRQTKWWGQSKPAEPDDRISLFKSVIPNFKKLHNEKQRRFKETMLISMDFLMKRRMSCFEIHISKLPLSSEVVLTLTRSAGSSLSNCSSLPHCYPAKNHAILELQQCELVETTQKLASFCFILFKKYSFLSWEILISCIVIFT